MDKNKPNLLLTITTKTWNKDTEDLYDFEAEEIITNQLTIPETMPLHSSCYLISIDDNLSIVKDIKEVAQIDRVKVIAELNYRNKSSFLLQTPSFNQFQYLERNQVERLWQVLPKNEQKPVKEGDIIKLGRVRLKFDKIMIKNNDQAGFNYLKTNTTNQLNTVYGNNMININMMSSQNVNQFNINPSNSNMNLSNNNIHNNSFNEKTNDAKLTDDFRPKYECRICYGSDSDYLNPLLIPCKCNGSMSYIHLKCLKQCIDSKITRKEEENFKIITWKNICCDICLCDYPKFIKCKTTVYQLVDLDINYEQYIIFDYKQFDDIKKHTFRKGIIIVKVTDDMDISIGRTQSNVVKLRDISVSRVHCFLTKKNNTIYITDKGSKFGTLLHLSKPFLLTTQSNAKKKVSNDLMGEGSSACLISGKHYFAFNLVKNCHFFSCLFSSSCCYANQTNDEEFILSNDRENNGNNNNRDKENNNLVINNNNEEEQRNYSYDSYRDHIIYVDTIIQHVESEK